MTIHYTRNAVRHLESIAAYITERNPQASVRIRQRIEGAISLLTEFPQMAREGALAGTRELIAPGLPYIVVHRLQSNGDIIILGIYHGAQLRPGQDETGS
jgi:plasmid stabilization system protein ParE